MYVCIDVHICTFKKFDKLSAVYTTAIFLLSFLKQWDYVIITSLGPFNQSLAVSIIYYCVLLPIKLITTAKQVAMMQPIDLESKIFCKLKLAVTAYPPTIPLLEGQSRFLVQNLLLSRFFITLSRFFYCFFGH